MNIPWYIEIVISFVLITIVCHTSYQDGYHKGYLSALEEIAEYFDAVSNIEERKEE